MIKNSWYIILSSKEVKDKPVGVTRLNEKLVLWRDSNGKVNCISNICCHRGAALSFGKIKDSHIQCPFHGFEYDSTGKVVYIPANGKKSPVPDNFKVKRYYVREQNDFIWLWYGDSEPDEEPEFFDNLSDMEYSEFREVWKVHYSRAIENQLDVVHLPFVHYNTIGRGERYLVNGPVVKWINNRMYYFYVFNQRDDGKTVPKKPEELDIKDSPVHLEFHFPNYWQNYITEKFRVFAAFVPIDDENTMIYLRFYVKLTNIRWINKMISKLSIPFNKKVLHQDKRVVETQIPKRSELNMNENLIQGDLPIIEYRKKRAELKGKNK